MDRSIVIVPVPLHARKLRQRGFNQSELIVREVFQTSPGGAKEEY